jgi:hypothetical protein
MLWKETLRPGSIGLQRPKPHPVSYALNQDKSLTSKPAAAYIAARFGGTPTAGD